MQIDGELRPADLAGRLERMWRLSAEKILAIEETCPAEQPPPVVTVAGRYTARAWTSWTQGFQFGSALLQFDATGDPRFLAVGRENTRRRMAPARLARGGPRPRLQQHQHLRQPPPPDARGPSAARSAGVGVLRVGAVRQRGGAGRPLEHDRRRRGLYLFVQRAALAILRHDPLVARSGRGTSVGPRPDGRERRADQSAGAVDPTCPHHGPL